MMRAPKLRTSIEGGAGSLTPAGGTLLAILDKVLLTGYNTTIGDARAPLGWSSPYAKDLGIGAYLAGAGTGLMYQFNDDNAVEVYRTAQIKGFESMSSVHEGFGEWGNLPFGKTYSSDVAEELRYNPEWWIIGDNRGFYMCIADHHLVNSVDSLRGRPVIIHYVGDFDSFIPDDTNNAIIVSHNTAARLDGTAANVACKLSTTLIGSTVGNRYYKSTAGALSGACGLLTPQGNRNLGSNMVPINPTNLQAGEAIPQTYPVLLSNPFSSSSRGKMPGLFQIFPHMVGQTGDTFSVDTKNYMIFNVAITATNWEQYAIQLDTW